MKKILILVLFWPFTCLDLSVPLFLVFCLWMISCLPIFVVFPGWLWPQQCSGTDLCRERFPGVCIRCAQCPSASSLLWCLHLYSCHTPLLHTGTHTEINPHKKQQCSLVTWLQLYFGPYETLGTFLQFQPQATSLKLWVNIQCIQIWDNSLSNVYPQRDQELLGLVALIGIWQHWNWQCCIILKIRSYSCE